MLHCCDVKTFPRYTVTMLIALFICLIHIPGSPLPAAGDTAKTASKSALSYKDVISGFESDNGTVVYETSADDEFSEKNWNLSGEFTLCTVYNISHESPDPGTTDYREFSRLRPELELSLDGDISGAWRYRFGGKAFYDFIYNLRGRHKFTDQVLKAYENEIELTEAYIEGALVPAMDLKIGRQIVVWGNTENFRITDMVNPEDNRDPGMVDIEDLRLPVNMAKISLYTGDYNFSLMAIPEIRFDKQPVFGNDFFPLDTTLPPEDKPDSGLDNIELAMAFKGVFHGWDMSLYGAYLFNDESHFETVGSEDVVVGQSPLPGGGLAPIIVRVPIYEQRHARLSMAGFAINVVRGSWILKTELAFVDGLRFNATRDKKSRIKGLIGFEYSGFTDTLIVLELVDTHLFDCERQMKKGPDYADKNRLETAFRMSRTLLHDRLELMLLVIAMGGKARDGAFERLTAAYELTDALSIKAGCVFYQDGGNIMYDNIHDNNRLFINMAYHF